VSGIAAGGMRTICGAGSAGVRVARRWFHAATLAGLLNACLPSSIAYRGRNLEDLCYVGPRSPSHRRLSGTLRVTFSGILGWLAATHFRSITHGPPTLTPVTGPAYTGHGRLSLGRGDAWS
jgi:hypothetical protein